MAHWSPSPKTNGYLTALQQHFQYGLAVNAAPCHGLKYIMHVNNFFGGGRVWSQRRCARAAGRARWSVWRCCRDAMDVIWCSAAEAWWGAAVSSHLTSLIRRSNKSLSIDQCQGATLLCTRNRWAVKVCVCVYFSHCTLVWWKKGKEGIGVCSCWWTQISVRLKSSLNINVSFTVNIEHAMMLTDQSDHLRFFRWDCKRILIPKYLVNN